MAPPFGIAGKRIYVAGHQGLVGGALTRRLLEEGATIVSASRTELDLRDQAATKGIAWEINVLEDVRK